MPSATIVRIIASGRAAIVARRHGGFLAASLSRAWRAHRVGRLLLPAFAARRAGPRAVHGAAGAARERGGGTAGGAGAAERRRDHARAAVGQRHHDGDQRAPVDEPGVDDEDRDHAGGPRTARAAIRLADRGAGGRAGETGRARGRSVAARQRRSAAGDRRPLAAGPADPRQRRARDSRRPRARPLGPRADRARSGRVRRRSTATVQRRTRRAAAELQGGQLPLRSGHRDATGAGLCAARDRRHGRALHGEDGRGRVQRLARARGRRLRGSDAAAVPRSLSAVVRRQGLARQPVHAGAVRAGGLSSPLGGERRNVARARAGRGCAGGCAAHRRPRVAPAGGGDPRHQQVQQQRDGAAALPQHRRREQQAAGEPGTRAARRRRLDGQPRAWTGANSCSRTARACRASNG